MKYVLAIWLALLLVVALAVALAPVRASAQTVTPEPTAEPTATVQPVATAGFFTFTVGAPVAVPVDDVFSSGVVASENATTVSLVFPAGLSWVLSAVAILGVVLIAKWVWSWVVG